MLCSFSSLRDVWNLLICGKIYTHPSILDRILSMDDPDHVWE
jgi:hypothetical protein